MAQETIRVTPASHAEVELWRLTRQVSDILRGLPWVLIGGQMVAIIEIEHGGSVGRASRSGSSWSRGQPPMAVRGSTTRISSPSMSVIRTATGSGEAASTSTS